MRAACHTPGQPRRCETLQNAAAINRCGFATRALHLLTYLVCLLARGGKTRLAMQTHRSEALGLEMSVRYVVGNPIDTGYTYAVVVSIIQPIPTNTHPYRPLISAKNDIL